MVKIFISYAHEDEKYKEELEKHLKPLQRTGVIASWNDREILPGVEWDEQIKIQIENAEVILFLISPDFIASDYIHDTEIKKALDRYSKKEVVIIPIILRPTDFSYLEISKFQALPKDGKPITTWDNKDEAWHDVAVQLRKVFTSQNNKGKDVKHPEEKPISKPSKNDSVKAQIQTLVAESKIEKAFESLLEVVKSKDDEDLLNRALLLSSSFNNMRRTELMGIIRNEDILINRAKINNGILSLLNEI